MQRDEKFNTVGIWKLSKLRLKFLTKILLKNKLSFIKIKKIRQKDKLRIFDVIIKKDHTIKLIELASKIGGYSKIFSDTNYRKKTTDILKKQNKDIIKEHLYINCIRNKLPELGVLIDKNKPNIICIQETLENSI